MPYVVNTMVQEWNKGNQMVRKIGDRQDPTDYLKQCMERTMAMEALAAGHIAWFTHKNPYGCWICDLILQMYRLIDSFEAFLGPSGGSSAQAEDISK